MNVLRLEHSRYIYLMLLNCGKLCGKTCGKRSGGLVRRLVRVNDNLIICYYKCISMKDHVSKPLII